MASNFDEIFGISRRDRTAIDALDAEIARERGKEWWRLPYGGMEAAKAVVPEKMADTYPSGMSAFLPANEDSVFDAPDTERAQVAEFIFGSRGAQGQWRQVPSTGGIDSGRWSFVGGPSIRIEVQSVNMLGAAGFEGWYTVHPIDADGRVVPLLSARGVTVPLGNLVPPMSTFTDDYHANFDSPSAKYQWEVVLRAPGQPTARNTLKFFFRVYTNDQ